MGKKSHLPSLWSKMKAGRISIASLDFCFVHCCFVLGLPPEIGVDLKFFL